MLIDTHTHLHSVQYDSDREAVLARMWAYQFYIFLIGCLLVPQIVWAVPPPDMVVGVLSSVFQIVYVGIVFVAAFVAASLRFMRVVPRWIYGAFGIVSLLLCGVWGFSLYRAHAVQAALIENDQIAHALSAADSSAEDMNISVGNNDAAQRFSVDNGVNVLTDVRFGIVRDFYEAIAYGRLSNAYEFFPQTVSRDIFDARFHDVVRVQLDRLWVINDILIGGFVWLCEDGNLCVQYELRLSMNVDSSGFVHGFSTYGVYVRDSVFTDYVPQPVTLASDVISNEELSTVLNDFNYAGSYLVLDAREDAEYKNGTLPGSMHMRPTELRAGAWRDLPIDQDVYVMCWSGIRGSQIAALLRSKGVRARYLENGASGWVEDGGIWADGISFKEKYDAKRYSYVLSGRELQREISQGVIIVDTRELARFDTYRIPYSINISFFDTPQRDRALLFAQLPPGARVVTACDGYVNCFDARITGVALEESGYEFIGRFAPVEEYKKFQ